MVKLEERIKALANYLEVSEDDIELTYDATDNVFTVKSTNEEYLVVDEDEAYQAAKLDIENLIDDIGIDSFSEGFQEWIFMNAVDGDWFADALRESEEYYVNDLEEETYGQDKFENRLIEELYENGLLTDADFSLDENSELDYMTLMPEVDLDSLKEEYVDLLVEREYNPIDWYINSFGSDSFSQVCRENMLIDWDKVTEECIDVDGVAHFIARYDSVEHDLGDGLYAYRQN